MERNQTSRTPRKTRDLERSRKEILTVAFQEVFVHGFQGVSVDDIVKKTSLTKGAFYHHFPTKMDLGYALVDEVIAPMIYERWLVPLQGYENPVEGVLKQMKILIGKADPAELKLGCPLNNLVQEMAPLDKGFRSRLQKALNMWVSELEIYFRQAKKDGHLKKEADPRQVAHFVVMAHEGIYGLMKGMDEPKLFAYLFEPLRTYFETISTKSLRI